MQSEVKNLPKSQILITVELTPEELLKFEELAASRISEKVEIPGYRKGQAPKAFVIAQVGNENFFQEVLNVALPKSYLDAVKEKNVQVISRPDVKVLSRSPLKFEATVAIFPEIKLSGFEKIKIPQEKVEVKDKEIDEVVEEMRKYRATFKPLDRGTKKGDRIEVDFQGFDEGGAAIDKTKSANHPLFLGEGTLVPGFEEALEDMKVGEKRKFPVKFPKDYHHEPLRAKTVHFQVELKRAEETILPHVDEGFVEQIMGMKKTVPEFRDAVKEDIVKRKHIDSRRNRENALLEKFMKDAKLDVPPILIEEEIDYMLQDFANDLEKRGLPVETYFKKLQEEKRDLRKEFLPEAEKRVRIRLVLNFLFRELKMEVTEAEMEKAVLKLLERAPEAERKAISENLQRKGDVYLRLKNNILLEKLFQYYLDKE